MARLSRIPPFNRTVELTAVPFFPQTRYECGPASLAMVLNFAGRRVTPAELAPKVYLPGRHGSLAAELVAATWREGRLPYVIAPRLHDLLFEVAAGHPVLVLENLAFDWYPDWHYAVVVGFNLRRGLVMLRSGKEARNVIPILLFQRVWARSHDWGMVVLAPGQMPATVQRLPYLKAAWGLERLGHLHAAMRAYRAATIRWPKSLDAAMGFGNSLYALGQKRTAASVFGRAARAHASPAAFNNLAQTLSDLRCYPAAIHAALRAVALSKQKRPLYEKTLREIHKAARNARAPRCQLLSASDQGHHGSAARSPARAQ
ncbi:MAG: PA2778 family cysteine peptidase [Acidiferrobacteraceae bacterium]